MRSPVGMALVSVVLVGLVVALVLSFVLDDADETSADEVVRLTLPGEGGGPSITFPPLTSVGETAPAFPYVDLDGEEVGDEVAFLGLAYPDTAEQARELVDRTGVTYDTGLDLQAEVFAAFEGNVFPTTVFIAADGTITTVYQQRVRPPELREELARLLA